MNELMTTDTKELSPEQLGGEIRLLTNQARRMALSYGIQIGYRLHLAHEKVGPHGWAEWLKKETDFSAASASRFESLYEGYGEDQGNLFGVGNKFPTLENLSISNALKLLAVPEEERENFAAEVGADSLSARELEKAIADKKAAEKRALEAERALHELEEGEGLAVSELQAKLDEMREDADKGKKALEEKAGLLDKLDQAARTEKTLKEQLRELETRPQPVAVQRDEKAIEEAVQQAKAAAAAEWSEKTKKLTDKLNEANTKAEKLKAKIDKASAGADEKLAAAEKETEKIRQELEDARRQLKLADADVTAFGIHFNNFQQELNQTLNALRRIADRDLATADKLTCAMNAVIERADAEVSAIKDRAVSAEAKAGRDLQQDLKDLADGIEIHQAADDLTAAKQANGIAGTS